MIKNFPKSRVCVIDIYPSFNESLKEAFVFAKTNNISLFSADGKRLLLSYCLKNINYCYNNINSTFPKVLALNSKSIKTNQVAFVKNHFNTLMNYVPLPYCGEMDLNSPELETAAELALNKFKANKKFNNFKTNYLKLKF